MTPEPPTETPRLVFRHICPDTIPGGLKSTNKEINRWFANDSQRAHADGAIRVTCAVEAGKPLRPLGFYALATVAEEISHLKGRYHPFGAGNHFSALQLVWLATDHSLCGRGIGRTMVGHVIRKFAELGPVIGLPHLIVMPAREDHERLVRFYGRLGFQPYRDGEAMHLSLQEAVHAVEKAKAAIERAKAAAA